MLPRPSLPRPTLSRSLPRPSISAPATQVPAATPAATKPAPQSGFFTQLSEYVAEPAQTVLPHGLSNETDPENELPAFLMDENWVPTTPEPEPPPEPAWDNPYGAGIAPSELAMRQHEQRSHGAPHTSRLQIYHTASARRGPSSSE